MMLFHTGKRINRKNNSNGSIINASKVRKVTIRLILDSSRLKYFAYNTLLIAEGAILCIISGIAIYDSVETSKRNIRVTIGATRKRDINTFTTSEDTIFLG